MDVYSLSKFVFVVRHFSIGIEDPDSGVLGHCWGSSDWVQSAKGVSNFVVVGLDVFVHSSFLVDYTAKVKKTYRPLQFLSGVV